MTITDDERREVAARLRYVAEHGAPEWATTACCIAECIGEDDYPLWSGSGLLFSKLADLIDPDPDLTCELEPTASERTNAPVRVYECDCCGKSCDVVYAEDYVYCPYCGRLNTAREVEVEE